uniref:hypothetical protein n=1 Tax=Bacillus thuringiensis TaxID=1428 RepID=UPI0011AB2854
MLEIFEGVEIEKGVLVGWWGVENGLLMRKEGGYGLEREEKINEVRERGVVMGMDIGKGRDYGSLIEC